MLKMMSVLSVAVLFFSSTMAFAEQAEGETGEAEGNATAPEPTAPRAEAQKTGNEYGGIFPYVKVGPVIDFSIPYLLNLAIETRILNQFGVGVRFGLNSSISLQDTKISFNNWSITGRWFPFQGSFLVGAAVGSHSIMAEGSSSVQVAGTSEKIPAKISFDISATTFTPHIGWLATWDSGFTLGTEFGAVIPFGSSSTLKTTLPNQYGAYQAAVEENAEYKKNRDTVEKAGKAVGDTVLPYVNFLRVGWMF